ncbi:hypothetical protein LTR40_007156, partial [Exophiala xenobiotica]
EDPEVCGQEFAIALRIVDFADLPGHKQDDLRALIWRRAMIRDNWLMINDTSGKDDELVQSEMQQTSLFRTIERVFLLEQFEGATVHLFAPHEILSREAFPSTLHERHAHNELEGVRKDMDKEQAKLKKFVEKGRLEDHYNGLVTAAQRTVRDIVDQDGEKMAQEATTESTEQ